MSVNEQTQNIHDVAAYVVASFDRPISTTKMHKLVYLSQAWGARVLKEPIFTERFETWANGPVSRDLYDLSKDLNMVGAWTYGDASRVSRDAGIVIDSVVQQYGGLWGAILSEAVADAEKAMSEFGPVLTTEPVHRLPRSTGGVS